MLDLEFLFLSCTTAGTAGGETGVVSIFCLLRKLLHLERLVSIRGT